MIAIGYLADYPAAIPTLVKWFRDQWPDYYASKSPASMEQDFLSEAFRDRLPSRLVAFKSNGLAGTIVLRSRAIEILPQLQPGLGGLYVVESQRGQGIGTELVRSGMKLAADQGYQTVYATTVVAAGILESLGWEFLETVIHRDEKLALYRCNLMHPGAASTR